jgi:hypothetical protein
MSPMVGKGLGNMLAATDLLFAEGSRVDLATARRGV